MKGTIGQRAVLLGLLALAGASAAGRDQYFNATSGAPLRAGVYGRIEVHGVPPPLISPSPLIARKAIGPVRGEPLYFYLPAGQVRKWSVYCQRYAACERPAYFVRMDDPPGKLGRWARREQALRHPGTALLSAGSGAFH